MIEAATCTECSHDLHTEKCRDLMPVLSDGSVWSPHLSWRICGCDSDQVRDAANV